MVAKFDDHLPLYRQAEIHAREGVTLETSTLSGWVGATAAALMPLVDLLRRDVVAGSAVLHGDDTPVPILAPGTGKTRTGRLWTFVRDERPHSGARPPAAVFFASPDRKGARPLAHLARFSGILQADGYAGFNGLYESGRIVEAACWAEPVKVPTMRTLSPSLVGWLAADVAFDVVERPDPLQRLASDGRAGGGVNIEELAPHMKPFACLPSMLHGGSP